MKVDLYGTALVLEWFGNVIEPGGSGVVIASQFGHPFPPLSAEQNALLATTLVGELRPAPETSIMGRPIDRDRRRLRLAGQLLSR